MVCRIVHNPSTMLLLARPCCLFLTLPCCTWTQGAITTVNSANSRPSTSNPNPHTLTKTTPTHTITTKAQQPNTEPTKSAPVPAEASTTTPHDKPTSTRTPLLSHLEGRKIPVLLTQACHTEVSLWNEVDEGRIDRALEVACAGDRVFHTARCTVSAVSLGRVPT